MSLACSCAVTLSNTGVPGCVPVMKVAKKLLMTATFKEDGTYNEIDLTDTLNAAYFTALINHANADERIFPFPRMKNVETTRAEPNVETFNDGSKEIASEGIRNFTALLPKQGPAFLKQIKGYRCTDISFYIVDADGNLIGDSVTNPGFLRPIRVATNSWLPQLEFPTDTTVLKNVLNFEWDDSMDDSYLGMIGSGDISTSLLSLNGLLDLEGTVVSTGQTAMVIDICSRYGTLLSPDPVEGLVTADFGETGNTSKIYNVTDAGWIAVTAAESTTVPGRYTLTYSSQTVSDVLMPAVKKNGYDDTSLRLELGTVV